MHLRYYLILIITIFLSLGLGMMIGISLESKDVLEKQQTMIAQQLEEEFVGIRNENRQLKEQINSLEEGHRNTNELCNILFTSLVQNRLEGLRVSIVEISDQNDYSELIQLLKLSGASIESNITLRQDIFSRVSNINDIIEVAFNQTIEGTELYAWLAENLIESLVTGKATQPIARLAELHLVRSLVDIQNRCDVVILAGNGKDGKLNDKQVEFDLHLIEASLMMELPIIAVENQKVNTSAIQDYKKYGISTVDHIDTVYGKLSLISLLSGNVGNYGVGNGADDGIMPNPLFPYDTVEYLYQNSEAPLEEDILDSDS